MWLAGSAMNDAEAVGTAATAMPVLKLFSPTTMIFMWSIMSNVYRLI
jgi:hypothetical protein